MKSSDTAIGGNDDAIMCCGEMGNCDLVVIVSSHFVPKREIDRKARGQRFIRFFLWSVVCAA